MVQDFNRKARLFVIALMFFLIITSCTYYRRPDDLKKDTDNSKDGDYSRLGYIYDYKYENKKNTDKYQLGNTDKPSTKSPISNVANTVVPSVVGISTVETARSDMFNQTQTIQGVGSGVIVHQDGYILTNDHVAGGKINKLTVILKNGDELDGKTLWSDPTLDLAVVKVNAVNLPAAKLGNSEKLTVGETAIAIGTPLGLQFQHTVTSGIISALNRTVQIPTERGENFMEDLIQTDASINPGNSGGPLVNLKGEIVGINTVKVVSAEGIGFAIPIDVAKPIINHFIKEGKFTTPYIGVVGFDRQIASYYKQNKDIMNGVYVVNIDPKGPAYLAGIRVDDIITMVGDQPVNNMLQLRKRIYSYNVGDKIKLKILRGGEEKSVTMTLTEKPI